MLILLIFLKNNKKPPAGAEGFFESGFFLKY
jgi:hypothetical protein